MKKAILYEIKMKLANLKLVKSVEECCEYITHNPEH